MRILLTSPMGDPLDSKTWPSAPMNLAKALSANGVDIAPMDSRVVGKPGKSIASIANLFRGLPIGDISRYDMLRAIRGRAVRLAADKAKVDHILCTSTVDTPTGGDRPYSIWVDDTVNLLQRTPMSPGYGGRALAMIDELDRRAMQEAAAVLPFSRHVADDIVSHYGVARDRVKPVGCGSGPIPPLATEKTYSQGDMLFVAKHQFAEKGGELLLAAWPEIRARRPQTRLQLIGNSDAVERAAGMDGVTAHSYLPWTGLVTKFHEAALLVQPMLGDPWGQVYLEAMKSRTIIVALNHRALPELTDNGRLAFLAQCATPTDIASTVLAAYAAPQQQLAAMAADAQTLVLDRHSWQAVADRVLAAIG